MQPRAPGGMRVPCVLRLGSANREGGAPADVVDEPVAAIDRLEAQLGHQPVIEGGALLEAADAQGDVGDAVDLPSHSPASYGAVTV